MANHPQDNTKGRSGETAVVQFLASIGLAGETGLADAIEASTCDQLKPLLGDLVNRGELSVDQQELIEKFSAVVLSDLETVGFEAGPSNTESLLRAFGDYEIISEIAKGGMGVVYKARQTKLNRVVALKMIRSAELADETLVKRFYAEAEAAAKLDHPGIVSVFDVGESGGQHYYSMAFVDGESLSDRVKRVGSLMPRDAATLIKEAAEAVQHAHDAGIVHRDIKPQNLLLNRQGKVQITDFGLAKLQQAGTELTADGQVLGTPAYMPPEQAAGRTRQVGEPADVYSLGATLYFLLTGRPPFQASTIPDTLRQVLEAEPVSIRKLNTSTPRDLETICLKALAKEPARRYDSAAELAGDLARWLNGEPIVARRAGRVERAWKWCRRRPVVSGLSVAIVLLTTVGSAVFFVRQNAAHARGLVDSLFNADPIRVPGIIRELDQYERWANPVLYRALADPADDAESKRNQLHARMSLADDSPELSAALIDDLLEADYNDIRNICDALERSNTVDAERLWTELRNDGNDADQQFRAAFALIKSAPDSNRWTEDDFLFLVEQLVATNGIHLPELLPQLAPLRDRLMPHLESVFKNHRRPQIEQVTAANAVGFLIQRDAVTLARLLQAASGAQYKILYDKYRRVANPASRRILVESLRRDSTPASAADERILRGRQQAVAAIALLQGGERELPLEVLRQQRDPEAMTQFIHRCRNWGVRADALIECFETVDVKSGAWNDARRKSDASVMYALLLSLGDYPITEIKHPEPLLERLIEVYAKDPSSGVHSAAGWLLRRWGKSDAVSHIDRTAVPYDETGHREWYVMEVDVPVVAMSDAEQAIERIYFTMIVFPPGEFGMGSQLQEPDRTAIEDWHSARISRTFAICDRELTWRQLVPADSKRRESWSEQYARKLALAEPVFGIGWPETVSYCIWLSQQAGLSIGEQCYSIPGNSTNEDWLLRLDAPGFRLPTEREWEYACRSGTTTPFFFGNDPSWLDKYGWFLGNSLKFSHPVAELRPNLRGLFDMTGNQMEWCHDWFGPQYNPESGAEETGPARDSSATKKGGSKRVNRGGSWYYASRFCRSASRNALVPDSRYHFLGFRVATTPVPRPAHNQESPAADRNSN